MSGYFITDRRLAGGSERLLECVRRHAGRVDFVQVREKDLSARELCRLVRQVLDACGSTRVIVNSRLDVALACGAHGVHLPGDSPAPAEFRRGVPPGFLLGVSCHSLAEALRAETEGADYVLFSPVFRPLSKTDDRQPLGLAGLSRAARALGIPVFALGGVTAENRAACLEAGAAGVAGISLFQARP